jgi:Flp pilus assembly protein TadD
MLSSGNKNKQTTHLLGMPLVALTVALFVFGSARAQIGGGMDPTGTGGQHSIHGRIYYPSGRRSDKRVMVKLETYNSGDLSVMSDANGSFTFSGLIPGSYVVVIDAGDEYEPVREPVYIDTEGNTSRTGIKLPLVPRSYTVQIALQLKREDPARPGVLQAALANVPEAARDHYLQALEQLKVGDNKKAVEELKAAISGYDDFPLALNLLGVIYLKSGQADKAAQVFEKSTRLTPQDFSARLHYGIALLNLRRYVDAEKEFRIALGITNSNPTAHMYLGITLAVQRKLEDGQRELQTAIDSKSPEVALAHRYLGGIFLERREYKNAAAELETYLKLVPNASDASVLQQTIKDLHSKS